MPAPDNADSHSIEPDILDADLTVKDLVWALQNLHFSNNKNALTTVRIDREVRNFIVRAIAPGRR
jgi:hypothetical protein